jgi:Fe2+ or Zn2+ uptake regulation protein
LRCLACGRIEEFLDPTLNALAQRLSDDTGFLVEVTRLEMTGLCPSCRQKTVK